MLRIGNLLVDLFIQWSREDCTINNIHLITDAEWHVDWMQRAYDKSTIYIFNATPAGLLGFIVLKSYPILKKHHQVYIQPHRSQRRQEWIGRLFHET